MKETIEQYKESQSKSYNIIISYIIVALFFILLGIALGSTIGAERAHSQLLELFKCIKIGVC